MDRTKRIFLVFLFSVLIPAVFTGCDGRKYKLPVKEFTIQKSDGSMEKIKAELAVKEEERNYGFMNRRNIPDGTGMLFIFDTDEVRHFWMKDCPSALSIAYILKSGEIVDILDMTPFSTASVSSSRSVRYALEVPQGWYERKGIKKGDRLLLE